MRTRRLGRTGHQSSLAVLGAAMFWDSTTEEARPAFDAALAAGVNHVDIAPQYGLAQRAAGPLVAAERERLFVACKTLRTSPDGVRAQLEESLLLLGCERFDLYQVHAVTSPEDLDARAPAFAALLRAREEGLASYLGVTGHGMRTCLAQAEAVRRYDLDTVMFPVNARMWADPDYRRSAEALLELAAERDLGVMAIKAAAARPWGDRPHPTSPWYEPYRDPDELSLGVRFTLSVPGVHAFCTPGAIDLLPPVLAAAAAFEPLDDLDAVIAGRAHEELIFDPA